MGRLKMTRVKVLIVDDQQLVRDGISSLLHLQEEIEVVGTATHGQEAIDKTAILHPQVILMDIRMPIMDGITATEKILQSGEACKILMLTTFDDEEYIIKSLKAGALGYLMKDIPIGELSRAVLQAHKGTYQLAPGVMTTLLEKINSTKENPNHSEFTQIYMDFSLREREVIVKLSQGMNNREIASALFLSEGTVKNYVSVILSALDLRDRTKAALIAIQEGWDKI